MNDDINSPRHYTGNGIECLDAMRSAMHDAPITGYQAFLWGAAFKYIWRWPFKNGWHDLEKAKRCIEILLKEIDTEVNTDLLPCQNVRIEGEVLTACGEEKAVEQ